MKIWVYALCYNESHFVGNFLTAYKEAERIVVYDNYSTDNSVDLLQKDHRVEIRYNDSGGEIRDDIYLSIKNNCWKEARGKADWVVIVDFDEIFLRLTSEVMDIDLDKPYGDGYTIIKPYGFNMISMDAPLYTDDHPWRWSQKGTYHTPNEKLCCFRPDKIKEINYGVGCHTCNPRGDVRIYYQPEYKQLHYKAWNYDLYMTKARLYRNRLSSINKSQGWGFQYVGDDEEQSNMFMAGVTLAKPILDYGY